MAGQMMINFEGLTPETAEKLAQGMVEAARIKIGAAVEAATKLRGIPAEDTAKLEGLLGGRLAADGNCGNGCA